VYIVLRSLIDWKHLPVKNIQVTNPIYNFTVIVLLQTIASNIILIFSQLLIESALLIVIHVLPLMV